MASIAATNIKCVVFDIDDTLYLERDYVRSGFHAVGEWVRETLGLDSFFREAWKCFEAGRRGDIFNVALAAFKITPSEELIQKMLSIYRGHDPAISLLSDSEECLRSVNGKTFIGVISDGAVLGQQMKVGRLGLASRCDHIILTESIGVEYSKPHPRAFLQMQQVANCAPATCVYIADNPIKDFVAPNRLGWRTIRVRRPGGIHCRMNCSEEAQPSIEMDNLKDVPALLGLV
ncbi:MAG: HAD family hydrolase [Bryobacteraceae bacterium]|jgi:putative hydrolase of the HAD superfamily